MTSISKWLVVLLLLAAPCLYASEANEQGSSLTVENIECEGNDTTACSTIKENIYLSPGDTIDDDELQNARTRLGLMGLFKSVDVSLKKGSERGKVNIVVKVVEASSIYAMLSAGVHLEASQSERYNLLGGYGRIGHRNLFGKGKILQAEGKRYHDITDGSFEQNIGRIEYVDPHFGNHKKVFLTAGLSGLSLVDRHSDGSLNDAKHLAANIALGLRVYDFSYVSLGYRRLLYRDYTYRSSNGEVATNNPGADLVYASFGWNDEDDPFFPRHGSRFYAMLGVGTEDRGGVELFGGSTFRIHWAFNEDFSGTFNLGAMRSVDEEAARNRYRLMFSDFNFGFRANYDSKRDVQGDTVRSARHYLEVGYSPFSLLLQKDVNVFGGKIGTTFHIEQFGLIDLYLFAGKSDR